MVVAAAFLFRTDTTQIQPSGRQWLGGDVVKTLTCSIRSIRRRKIQVLLVTHTTLRHDRPVFIHIPIITPRARRMHEADPGSTRPMPSADPPLGLNRGLRLLAAHLWSGSETSLRQGQNVRASAIILDIHRPLNLFPYSRGRMVPTLE